MTNMTTLTPGDLGMITGKYLLTLFLIELGLYHGYKYWKKRKQKKEDEN